MSRLDFSGLRDELVLDNLPTDKHPEGRTYTVREPRATDVQRLLEIFDDLQSGDDKRARAGAAAMEQFLTVAGRQVSMLRRLLGDSLDPIEKDGLSASTARVLEQSLIATAMSGPEIAQQALERVVAGEARARTNRATRRAAAKKAPASSPKAGSRSNRASTGARARTAAAASTRSSATSAPRKASARKAG